MDEPICKVEIETQMQRISIWTPREERVGGIKWGIKIDICIYTIDTTYEIDNENLL